MNNRELYDHLLALRNDAGDILADAIVEAAKPKTHPLHALFEWDNRAAGHQYRLHQARVLIRSVVIEDAPTDDAGHQTRVRAIVSAPTPNGPRYRPTVEVAEDPVAAELVLRQFEAEWRQFRARWQHLAAFMDRVRRDVA
jgi:hypothetical protein